jgi:hypothetical protein
MRAAPRAEHVPKGEGARRANRGGDPAAAPRRENQASRYLVHPSLMPTVYAPSAPPSPAASADDVAARKV